MYEQQRDQLQGQQFNIDQTSFAIETVRSTQTTVAAMKTATKTLKKENKKISLAEIEDMQDEMEGNNFAVKMLSKHCIAVYYYCSFVHSFTLVILLILCIDLLEDVGEISDILGRSYGSPDGIEEEDLDAELACLEDEWAAEDVDFSTSTAVEESATSLPSMPSQPTAAPSVFSKVEATAATEAQPAPMQYNSLV